MIATEITAADSTKAAIGAGIITAALLATQLLPRDVTVMRKAQVNASPSDVIALLASNEGYQKINPYKASDENLKITLFGPSSGVGSGFHFDGKDGKGSTADFLSGMVGSLPPLHEITKNAGIELPEFLGKLAEQDAAPKKVTPKKSKPSTGAEVVDDQ